MASCPDRDVSARRAFVQSARDLSDLLRSNGAEFWATRIAVLAERAGAAVDDADAAQVAVQARHLFGGMGSLNDLVLQVDGAYPRALNDRLEALRSELYTAAHSLL